MNLQDYLKADRQWPRHCRIGHAKLMLSMAQTKEDRAFWNAVLEANGALKKRKQKGKRK